MIVEPTDPFRFVILIRNGQCRHRRARPALPIGALGKGVRDPPSIIRNEQRRLIFRPIDDVEKHSAPNHFSFESSSVHFPLLGWPSSLRTLALGQAGVAELLLLAQSCWLHLFTDVSGFTIRLSGSA